jgi:ATP-dependent Clp protease, protease subunit
MLIPTVIESSGHGERAFDIYSRLLKDRIVFVGTQLDDSVANVVVAQLLFLQSEDPEKEVSVYINSPGGSVTAATAIYDAMQFVSTPVSTLCIGFAASGGSLLLAGGNPGRRYALPHATIVVHQPWTTGIQGQATDIDIHAREILRVREEWAEIYSTHCNRPKEQVERDMERDFYMTPEQGVEWGIIDQVMTSDRVLVASNGHRSS